MANYGLDARLIEQSLAEPDIHLQWESAYRTRENERFFETAFDAIARLLDAPANAVVLDVGCGPCLHAIRLAKRGFFVQAIDFSASVLAMAQSNVRSSAMEGRVTINRANLLALPFANNSVEYLLCWGVLMHVPDVERATAELMRVVRPGGMIVLAENNMASLQTLALRALRRLRGGQHTNIQVTPAGIEAWSVSPAGPIMVRQANIGWLIERFQRNQFDVKARRAGQFTELYTKISSPSLRWLVHRLNALWFSYIKSPRLAFGNIVVFQKRGSVGRNTP
jgi:ubiquinone/menaquinone biosynthesis C-methylase UbiE